MNRMHLGARRLLAVVATAVVGALAVAGTTTARASSSRDGSAATPTTSRSG